MWIIPGIIHVQKTLSSMDPLIRGDIFSEDIFLCRICNLTCKCPLTRGHILCRDTINVMLMHLLINGCNAHSLDMKNRRKSVSTSVKTW